MSEAALAADIVKLLIERGEELRKAGVTELELGSMKVKFAPFVDEVPVLELDKEEPTPGSFDDPGIYGLPQGASVPGFAKLRERRRRDDS